MVKGVGDRGVGWETKGMHRNVKSAENAVESDNVFFSGLVYGEKIFTDTARQNQCKASSRSEHWMNTLVLACKEVP